jgi:hypothetical protein
MDDKACTYVRALQVQKAWKLVRRELDQAISDLKAAGLYQQPGERGTKRAADGAEKGVAAFLAQEQQAAHDSSASITDALPVVNDRQAFELQVGDDERLRNLKDVKRELGAYIVLETKSLDADPLAWWRLYHHQFPGLARLAMHYLCIPASSAGVERFFSGMGLVVSSLRSCLSSESVEALVYLRLNWEDWLYHIDYREVVEGEEAKDDEPDSEGEDDYIEEGEEEEEAEQVPDFEELAAELARDDQGVGPIEALATRL